MNVGMGGARCLRGHGDVAAVNDFGPAVERVCLEWDVVAAAGKGAVGQWSVEG